MLKYHDLSHQEQLEYERIVAQGPYSSQGSEYDGATAPDSSQPAGARSLLASAQALGGYVSGFFRRDRDTPQLPTAWSQLAQFIRTQAANRGCESFNRNSFPNFPAEVDPFAYPADVEAEPAYPEALHEIVEAFRNAAPAQHLEMLLSYTGRLPELPEELRNSRDTMEQVDECMTPVFLTAQMRDGRVYYHIDVPAEAPTMRGFAGLLYTGLNGATPAAIAATPGDLCQQLGIQKALGSLRSRGLTALLRRMQRNAVDLAKAQ